MDRNTADIFGSEYDSSGFDIIEYFKRPYIIIRALGWLFSIIVFGCISTSSRYTGCPYIDDAACGFGITIGVLIFLYLTALLFADAFIWKYLDYDKRKYFLIFDCILSGFFSFMWFVCFCYLVDTWRRREDKYKYRVSDTQAAIAFSFFSIFIFVSLCIMAVQRFRKSLVNDDDMLTVGGNNSRADVFNEPASYQQADFDPAPFNEQSKNSNYSPPAGYQQQ